MPDHAILAEGLRKVFPARHTRGVDSEIVAVDDVSFDVPAGGSLAIVGDRGPGGRRSPGCSSGSSDPLRDAS